MDNQGWTIEVNGKIEREPFSLRAWILWHICAIVPKRTKTTLREMLGWMRHLESIIPSTRNGVFTTTIATNGSYQQLTKKPNKQTTSATTMPLSAVDGVALLVEMMLAMDEISHNDVKPLVTYTSIPLRTPPMLLF